MIGHGEALDAGEAFVGRGKAFAKLVEDLQGCGGLGKLEEDLDDLGEALDGHGGFAELEEDL